MLRNQHVDVVKRVADAFDESQARVALAWVLQRPGVSSTLMGVSKVEQLRDNINSLDIRLSGEQLEALDAASAPTQKMLYS